MEHFNTLFIKNKITQYIDKINNIQGLSDNCKQKLNEMKNEVNLIVKERCISLESIDKHYKDSSDFFNKEYESPRDECRDIKSLTFDIIHLVLYLETLIELYTNFQSKEFSETDKINAIERSISIIQCPDDIIADPISLVFSYDNEDEDEYE